MTTSEVEKRHLGGPWEQQAGDNRVQSTESQRAPRRRAKLQVDGLRERAMGQTKSSPLGDKTKKSGHEESRVRQEAYNIL